MSAQQVTTQQPLPGDWLLPGPSTPLMPPGLEYLVGLDTVIALQQMDWVEGGVFDDFETNNRFVLKSNTNKHIFYSVENSGCCIRYWCGPRRPFGMKVVDSTNTIVMHLERPCRCDWCCFPGLLQVMGVECPKGTKVGSVEQVWNLFIPKFRIRNEAGEVIHWIKGPFCTNGCCGDPEFTIYSKDMQMELGKINKEWMNETGSLKDAFKVEDPHPFGVTFPVDMDVKTKAVLVGALFLIDFMYYETSENDNY